MSTVSNSRSPHGASENSNKRWRYTREGWQQLEIAPQMKTHFVSVPPHRPAYLHPIRLATMVLLGVLAIASWSSDEWDWSRLM